MVKIRIARGRTYLYIRSQMVVKVTNISLHFQCHCWNLIVFWNNWIRDSYLAVTNDTHTNNTVTNDTVTNNIVTKDTVEKDTVTSDTWKIDDENRRWHMKNVTWKIDYDYFFDIYRVPPPFFFVLSPFS